MRAAVFPSLLLLAVGCSATDSPSTFGNTDGSGGGTIGTGAGGMVGTGDGGTTGSGGAGPSSDCAAAAQLIYVLSDKNDLYSFDPQKKLFKKIGPLQCKTPMQPNSMAIDRNANA